jgi:hypothetical protein
VVEAVQQTIDPARDALTGLAPYLESAKWLLLAVTLIGIGVMLWARIDDHRKGLALMWAMVKTWLSGNALRLIGWGVAALSVARFCWARAKLAAMPSAWINSKNHWRLKMPNFVRRWMLLVIAVSLLTACATANSDPDCVCPPIRKYDREFQRKLADEIEVNSTNYQLQDCFNSPRCQCPRCEDGTVTDERVHNQTGRISDKTSKDSCRHHQMPWAENKFLVYYFAIVPKHTDPRVGLALPKIHPHLGR